MNNNWLFEGLAEERRQQLAESARRVRRSSNRRPRRALGLIKGLLGLPLR